MDNSAPLLAPMAQRETQRHRDTQRKRDTDTYPVLDLPERQRDRLTPHP